MKKSISLALATALFTGSVALSFAQTATATTPVTTSAKKTVDVACVQSAIEKRDSAISAGISTLGTSLTSALSARKDALKAAVALPTKTEAQAARKAANTAFDKSAKTARTTMKSTRDKAWSTYKTEVKVCGQKEVEAPTATESAL